MASQHQLKQAEINERLDTQIFQSLKNEQVQVKPESIYNDRNCNRKLDQCQDSFELLKQNRELNSHFPSTLSQKPNKNKVATEPTGAFMEGKERV